jgi:hypothetical protein
MTKRMIPNLRQIQALVLALLFIPLHASCGETRSTSVVVPDVTPAAAAAPECDPNSIPPPRSAFTIQEGSASQAAAAVSAGAGKVIAAGQGSKNRTLFIFEEKHDSRVGQMEIALMLWRLQRSHGLRQISLEGALFADGDLPAKWFHDATGSEAAKRSGREAALSLLREGEINAAEFIALAQPLVQVKGNEVKSEYDVEPSENNGALIYLIGIAERSVPASDIRRIEALMSAKKSKEALDLIFSHDPWARERYQKVYGDIVSGTEESASILREVEKRVRELGVRTTPQIEAGFREDLNFYQTASTRSCTIVRNTLAMMDANSNAPLSLIIGAAHTPKVVELIKAAQLNYAVISPLDLVASTKAPGLTVPMYERKSKSKSVDERGMLGALLDGRKKLPPVLGRQWLQSKAELYAAIDLLVAAAARGGPMPSDELKAELQSFKSIQIDLSSIKVVGKGEQVQVTCKATALTSDDDPQQSVNLWVKGGLQPPEPPDGTPPDASSPGDDFERLILIALDKERDRTKPPPTGRVAVVQLTTRTRAAFSTDPTLLKQVTVAR